jgi:D-xylose 1-dehydrogenase (NADP+, D-xylono-1,5-lactone-forming)
VDERGRIGWGVLGAARIAWQRFVPGVTAADGAYLAAVGAREQARASALVAEAGSGHAYGSYRQVLDDPAVDAVYIPLPNGLHREWTLAALAAGKHVLCEKSLVTSAAEVDELAAAAGGLVLMEAFMYRFHPQFQPATWQPLLERIGEPRYAQARFAFDLDRPEDIRWQARLGGGALWDVGCYCLNVLLWQLGEVTRVRATGRTVGGVDQAGAATLEFASGALASAWWSFAAPRQQRLELLGSDGRLELDGPFMGIGSAEIRLVVGDEPRAWTPPPSDQFQREVEHFGRVVRGQEPLAYPLAESKRWIALAEEIQRQIVG